MKKIGIYGMFGLYNYGCEAILRGTVEFIRMYDPDAEIYYFSKNFESDKMIIDDLNINIVNIHIKYTILKKIILKIINIFNIQYFPFLKKEYKIICDTCEIIFSVGGDIYTIPAYLRKKEKYNYKNYLVEFSEYAMKKNKKIIIYGASIGPFGNYDKAVKYYANHFMKITKIICRENESIVYLSKIGVKNNVYYLPDPAFLVKGEIFDSNNQKYIGLNLSELSLKEVYGSEYDNKLIEITNIISELYIKEGRKIILIPHVFSPTLLADNDYNFLKKLYNSLSDNMKEKCILVSPTSFLDTKKYLSQCKYVIAARMHCAVNAITTGIPAIFISYSMKSVGMAQFVYGNDELVLSLEKIETIFDKIDFLNKNYNTYYKKIIGKNSDILILYNDFLIRNRLF